MSALLELKEVNKSFGGVQAVRDMSFVINKGELAGLIGPNGAGKTTIFNLVTGVYDVTSGDIVFKGESIAKLKTFQVISRGIARTFQNLRLSVAPALFDILHRHIKLPFIPEVEQIQPPVSLLQVKLLQHGLIRAVHPIIVRRIITVSVIGLSVRAEHIQMIRVKIIGIQNRQMKIMQRPPSSNPYHPVVVPVILGLYSEYIFLRHFSPVPSLFLLFQKPVFIIP